MPRRLSALAILALLVAVSAGCADDVAPAARFGDSMEISTDELLTEVAQWARSPALLEQVGLVSADGAGPGSFGTPVVGVVLTNRIRFDLHQAQFDALALAPSPEDAAATREQLAPVLAQLDPAFGDGLIGDLVRVNAVASAMGDGYEAWFTEALSGDIDVNPRYGSWDPQQGSVVPPEGPRPAPGVVVEL